MRHWTRALSTLVAAAVAGFLLWYVPHFDRWHTGGYWGVIGLMAAGGVVIGFSQLHGRDGNPRSSFLIAFLPVLVAAGWVILAAQPRGSWVRDHVLSWSGDLGIEHAVRNLAEHVAVLAFGLGLVFGVTFEPGMLTRARQAGESPGPPPADAQPAPLEETRVGDEEQPPAATSTT